MYVPLRHLVPRLLRVLVGEAACHTQHTFTDTTVHTYGTWYMWYTNGTSAPCVLRLYHVYHVYHANFDYTPPNSTMQRAQLFHTPETYTRQNQLADLGSRHSILTTSNIAWHMVMNMSTDPEN